MTEQITIAKRVGGCLAADGVIAIRTAEFGGCDSGNYIGIFVGTLVDGLPYSPGSAPQKICAYAKPFFALLGEKRAAAFGKVRQLAVRSGWRLHFLADNRRMESTPGHSMSNPEPIPAKETNNV